jgi:lysozyme family protein
MATLNKLIPLLLKWEGGYVNDPADRGGATNKGVTIATWKQQGYDKNGDGVIDVEDLKMISVEDVIERILRPHYWNRWQADRIDSQALANILVDWVWGSGRWGITIPQGILGVPADGIVGEKTLRYLNEYPDPEALFEKIKQVRRAYLNMICIDRPANKRFLKGWINRLNDFKWIPMSLL